VESYQGPDPLKELAIQLQTLSKMTEMEKVACIIKSTGNEKPLVVLLGGFCVAEQDVA
jgi:hypothetical protein